MPNNNKNKLELFKANPSKALWTLSVPMMLGMSVQAIYMLVDTAFIGKWVGGEALTGLGIIFPPMFIIMGITFGLGSGATTVIAQSGNGEWIPRFPNRCRRRRYCRSRDRFRTSMGYAGRRTKFLVWRKPIREMGCRRGCRNSCPGGDGRHRSAESLPLSW